MGNHTDTPKFDWHRRRSGLYIAQVDGIDYAAQRLRHRSWDLAVSTGYGYERRELLTMWGDSYRAVRVLARRTHTDNLTRAREIGQQGTRISAVVSDALMAAIGLPTATFELNRDSRGWFAHYSVRDGGQWVRLFGFKPTGAQAIHALDQRVRAELRPGGKLAVIFTEQ